jgi:hypothetical protein
MNDTAEAVRFDGGNGKATITRAIIQRGDGRAGAQDGLS